MRLQRVTCEIFSMDSIITSRTELLDECGGPHAYPGLVIEGGAALTPNDCTRR